MIVPGQTLENPVTGERFDFAHVHPQTERFEMLAGQVRFRIGLRARVAGPGDVVEVAPGVMHGFANVGADETRVQVRVSPALAMELLAPLVLAARSTPTGRGTAPSPSTRAAAGRGVGSAR